jgi:NYN domain-containing protein
MVERLRVRIFIDFWNFQLQWNKSHASVGSELTQIPWKDLPSVLLAEAARGQAAKFAGAHVYASVDPESKKDRGLKKWLHHVLNAMPGYSVDVKERKPRGSTLHCNNENCKASVEQCPKCGGELCGTVEKGVDAAIITDLLSMAFDDNYDNAVLVSGDADYAPAVQYIQKKTDKQIVQAFFKSHGDQLRTACWDHIFFEDLYAKLNLVPVAPKTIATGPKPALSTTSATTSVSKVAAPDGKKK